MLSNKQGPWLIMLGPYFGRWLAWINFFVESCKWNRDIHWRLYTDCGEPENRADNIDFVPVKFEDYKAFVRARLGTTFDPVQSYKLCDLKPALGLVHEQDTIDYPFLVTKYREVAGKSLAISRHYIKVSELLNSIETRYFAIDQVDVTARSTRLRMHSRLSSAVGGAGILAP